MFKHTNNYEKRSSDLSEIFAVQDAEEKKEKLKAFMTEERKLCPPGKVKTLPLFVLAQNALDELVIAEIPFMDIGFSKSTLETMR